jgi:hypothetical protein
MIACLGSVCRHGKSRFDLVLTPCHCHVPVWRAGGDDSGFNPDSI